MVLLSQTIVHAAVAFQLQRFSSRLQLESRGLSQPRERRQGRRNPLYLKVYTGGPRYIDFARERGPPGSLVSMEWSFTGEPINLIVVV